MGRSVYISALIVTALTMAFSATAQDIRLANGIIIKGNAVGVSAKGLEVKVKTSTKTYEWQTLSAGTRYRYDAKFRANYELILKGLPPYALTNAPDREAVNEALTGRKKETPKTEKSAVRSEAKAPDQITSLNLFDQAEYENVDPIYSSKIPPLTLKAPDLATYIGFQYGPGKEDVLYLIFDTKSREDVSDALYPYTPSLSIYEKPKKLTGFKKKSGGVTYVDFKKFSFAAKYGSVSVNYDFDCNTSGTKTNVLDLTITVVLRHKDTKSRFILNGRFSDLLEGSGLINVNGVLDLPILWLGLDTSGQKARLVGNLNMSHMKLAPKDGMDSRLSLVIKNESGKVVDKKSIKLDTDSFTGEYGIVYDAKKLDGGKRYTVNASIDLGPFLGRVDFEDEFTMPKQVKK